MRTQLTLKQTQEGIDRFTEALIKQLKDKGKGTFASIHEISGSVDEEVREFKDAVHDNDHSEIQKELLDIAVAAVWGNICVYNRTVDW